MRFAVGSVVLKRCPSVFGDLVFDSRVEPGMSSLFVPPFCTPFRRPLDFDAQAPRPCLRANFRVVPSNYAEFLHAEVEGRPFHSQTCRSSVGTGDNPPGMLESLANVLSLRVFQRNCPQGLRFRNTLQAR
jgi:hypothetical protein